MKKSIFIILALGITGLLSAGNPDRQGEAGAYELLLTPWARTAGLNALNTSFVSGLESIRLNPAGLARISGSEVILAHTRYFEGTDISINAGGYASKSGENGGFGIAIEALDFGEIPITTTANPEGTGGTFAPLFLNVALSYAKSFDDKIFVGLTGRFITQSISELSATGFALDAGVQYVTGPKENFKFGVVLRNFGTPMKFSGQGLAFEEQVDVNAGETTISFDQQAKKFELPSQLNIGISYDLYAAQINRISLYGSFIANSFSLDQVGGGVEYAFKEQFMVRASYKTDIGDPNIDGFSNVYTGLALGASLQVPLSKESTNKFGIDYAYRTTNPFNGTHNLSVRFIL